MTKICSLCHEEKSLDSFYRDKAKKGGTRNDCKACTTARQSIHYGNNKQIISTRQKEYYSSHKEKIRERNRAYNLSHSAQLADARRKHNAENRDSISIKQRIYRESHAEEIAAYQKVRAVEHAKELSEYKHGWYLDNKEDISRQRRNNLEQNPIKYMVARTKSRAKSEGLPFALSEEDISIPEFCPILGIKLEMIAGRTTDATPSLDKLIPEYGYVRGNCFVISSRANRIKANGTANEHRRIADWIQGMDDAPPSTGTNPFFGDGERHLIYKARERSKEQGLEMLCGPEDVVIPERCPILNIPLVRGKGKRHDGSPTLDRVDPSKGYVPGNIAVLSYRANWIKNNGTAEEHMKIADWMDKMLGVSEKAA